jgi:hypothetical protein
VKETDRHVQLVNTITFFWNVTPCVLDLCVITLLDVWNTSSI